MRYLPPVYSRQSVGTICAAAATVGIGRGEECSSAATAALERLYPGYHAILLNSGTSALTMALQLALGSPHAASATAPVIALPAYACPDLGTAAVAVNARVTLFDVDPHTLEPDAPGVERCLRQGAQVVVAAHLYGRVVDLRHVRALCDQFGAVLVEDAAQHAGGSVGGVRGGAQADLSVLSFGRGKGLNAGGGGALLLRKSSSYVAPSAATAVGSARPLVASMVTELLSSPLVYGIPARIPSLGVGETRYHAPAAIAAMAPALAFLLTKALRDESMELRQRREREGRYDQELRMCALPHAVMFSRIEGSGALRTPVALDPQWAEQQRTRLSPLGIVRSYPRTLAGYAEVATRLSTTSAGMPGADYLAARVHTLPTHRYVRERDVREILQVLGAGAQHP